MKKNEKAFIYFVSLGCPRNLVDSEQMIGSLQRAGYELTPHVKKGDFLIVNTCGFLKESCEEACEVIEELFRDKKRGAKVIATGCLVQREKEILKKRFPEIHYLLGSGDLEKIVEAVQSKESGEEISAKKSYLGEEERFVSTPSHFAYLKIAEGCRKKCAYCVIPQIKGPLRSKEVEKIFEEFLHLLERGVKEIILVAQDLGDYGKDLSLEKNSLLVPLLKKFLEVKGEFWIRLLYVYPDEVEPSLLELMASDSRICPYLDLPLQHVSDPILKAMNRNISKKKILKTIKLLREKIPHIVIRTSFIVGFPGETEKDFEELLEFVKEHKLDHVGIFTFSAEEGTRAFHLPKQISQRVKEERKEILAEAQFQVVLEKNKKRIGKRYEVFVEKTHESSKFLLQGRFYGQSPEIDSVVILNEGTEKVSEFGKRFWVEISDVAGYDLIGKIISSCDEEKLL